MNGRVYDPEIARFLSPDPQLQEPGNWLNYNRYTYCLNNPMMYTDPTGEFFGTILTYVGDLLKTAFFDGGLDPTSSKARRDAWRSFDPTAKWSATNKAWRIDKGLLKTDPKRTIAGQGVQLLLRFTWELPQTMLGNMYSHGRNLTGNVDDVSYYCGATLVNKNKGAGKDGFIHRWGLTLGSYINSQNLVADPYTDDMFRHEYGHTLQSRLVGPLYIPSVGIPSLGGAFLDRLGLNDHSREWYETQANRMSKKYLENHDPGALEHKSWNETLYPTQYNPNLYWIIAPPPTPLLLLLLFLF